MTPLSTLKPHFTPCNPHSLVCLPQVLDEPATKQSDATVLNLQLRQLSKQAGARSEVRAADTPSCTVQDSWPCHAMPTAHCSLAAVCLLTANAQGDNMAPWLGCVSCHSHVVLCAGGGAHCTWRGGAVQAHPAVDQERGRPAQVRLHHARGTNHTRWGAGRRRATCRTVAGPWQAP